MDGLNPIVEYEEDGSVPKKYVDPKGALCLTANSASGSKYYKIQPQKFEYSAVQNQERRPNVTNIHVTDTTFKAVTYRSEDGSIVDEVILEKSLPKEPEKPVDPIKPEEPNTPEEPNKPEEPSKPESPFTPGFPSIPWFGPGFTNPEKTEKTEKSEDSILDIKDHWAEKTIRTIVAKEIMKLEDKKFYPNRKATRFEVVEALAKVEKVDPKEYQGKSTLKDILEKDEQSAYVNWAVEKGIVTGFEDQTFKGNLEVTREQEAAILNRYVENLKLNFPTQEEIIFVDHDKISNWALEDVKKATQRGLLKGKDTKEFDPLSNITRAEIAQILINILEKK